MQSCVLLLQMVHYRSTITKQLQLTEVKQALYALLTVAQLALVPLVYLPSQDLLPMWLFLELEAHTKTVTTVPKYHGQFSANQVRKSCKGQSFSGVWLGTKRTRGATKTMRFFYAQSLILHFYCFFRRHNWLHFIAWSASIDFVADWRRPVANVPQSGQVWHCVFERFL